MAAKLNEAREALRPFIWAVYCPSSNTLIDFVPRGFSAEAAVAKYGADYGSDLLVLPIDDAAERYENGFKAAVQEITEERWWYALEVLPPVMWCHRGGGERFPMMEHIAGSIVNIYVRIGKRFFHFADPRLAKARGAGRKNRGVAYRESLEEAQ